MIALSNTANQLQAQGVRQLLAALRKLTQLSVLDVAGSSCCFNRFVYCSTLLLLCQQVQHHTNHTQFIHAQTTRNTSTHKPDAIHPLTVPHSLLHCTENPLQNDGVNLLLETVALLPGLKSLDITGTEITSKRTLDTLVDLHVNRGLEILVEQHPDVAKWIKSQPHSSSLVVQSLSAVSASDRACTCGLVPCTCRKSSSASAGAVATLPLTPDNFEVSSTTSGKAKDKLADQDTSTYWESNSSGCPHWIDLTFPSKANYPSVEIYTKDHDSFSPKEVSIHFHNGGNWVKAKHMALDKTPHWVTLVSSEEMKKLHPRAPPAKMRLQIDSNHDGRDCRVCALRLVAGRLGNELSMFDALMIGRFIHELRELSLKGVAVEGDLFESIWSNHQKNGGGPLALERLDVSGDQLLVFSSCSRCIAVSACFCVAGCTELSALAPH